MMCFTDQLKKNWKPTKKVWGSFCEARSDNIQHFPLEIRESVQHRACQIENRACKHEYNRVIIMRTVCTGTYYCWRRPRVCTIAFVWCCSIVTHDVISTSNKYLLLDENSKKWAIQHLHRNSYWMVWGCQSSFHGPIAKKRTPRYG